MLLTVAVLWVSVAIAQKTQVPEAVQATLDRQLGGAEVKSSKKKKDNYKMLVNHKGIEKTIVIAANGAWVSTSYDVAKEQLPKEIKNHLKENYKGSTYESGKATLKPKKSFYDLVYVKKNGSKVYLKYDGEGAFIAERVGTDAKAAGLSTSSGQD